MNQKNNIYDLMLDRSKRELELMRGYRVAQIKHSKEWIAEKNAEIEQIDRRLNLMNQKEGGQTKL